MMKSLKLWVCVATMAAGSLVALQVTAQENTTEATAKKESRGPLPAQFGKLGLSDEMKDELYKIDDDYDAKIATLAAQIKQLQAERDAKMQEKLTPAQKTQLKELRDAAAAKRAQKEKLKEAAKKPATTVTPAEEKKP